MPINKESMTMGPVGTAASGVGMGIVNNVSNLVFGRAIQKQQLKGYKESLAAQNDAAYDLWERTNYSAQVAQMKKAGLNPGLLYGMGAGGGGTTGGGGSMPTAGGGQGMDIAGAAQLALLKSQTEMLKSQANLNNVEAAKKAGIDTKLGEGQLQNIIAQTANEEQKNVLLKLDEGLKKIETNVADSTQWYHIGKVEQDWLKSIEDYRISAAKAAVDQATIETNIKTASADLAIKILQQKAIKKGMELNDKQMEQINATISTMMKDAETNRWNAESNAQGQNVNRNRQLHDQYINDIANSTKLTYETVQDVLQAIIIKGGIQSSRNPIGFK